MNESFGLYIAANTKGQIKRKLITKSGERDFPVTTISDEIIFFSELNFKYYAMLVDHLDEVSKQIQFDDEELCLEVDMDLFEEFMRITNELLDELEKENPLQGALTRYLLEDRIPPDDGTALFVYNTKATVVKCLNAVMEMQFVINDVLYDLREGTELDLENKYYFFKEIELAQIITLGESDVLHYRFRSILDYYIFLMVRFISANPNVAWCECCGKYFIPKTKKKTLYCDRILKDGKTCKELAPLLKHKRVLKNDPVIELFERTKRKMCKRRDRTIDYFEPRPKSLSLSEFFNWLDKAETAKAKYLQGELTAEEAIKIIEVND